MRRRAQNKVSQISDLKKSTKKLANLIIDNTIGSPSIVMEAMVAQSLNILLLEDQIHELKERLCKNGLDITLNDQVDKPSKNKYLLATNRAIENIKDMESINDIRNLH